VRQSVSPVQRKAHTPSGSLPVHAVPAAQSALVAHLLVTQ